MQHKLSGLGLATFLALALFSLAKPGYGSTFGLRNNLDIGTISLDTGLVSQTSPLSNTLSRNTTNIYGATEYVTQTDTSFYGSLFASASGLVSNSLSSGATAGAGGDSYPNNSVAAYVDSIHITSSTLAVNTPVSVLFTEVFQASASYVDPTDNARNYNGTQAYVFDRLQARNGNGIGLFDFTLFASGTQTETINTFVGDTVRIQGDLYAFGEAWAGYYGAPLITASFQYEGSDPLSLNVLTPGAGYTADSGTIYGSALGTPEPGTGLLALLSLVVAGAAAWRRTRPVDKLLPWM